MLLWQFLLSLVSIAISQAGFGQGSGLIFLDNVRCTGTEFSLLSCSHRGIGVHNYDVPTMMEHILYVANKGRLWYLQLLMKWAKVADHCLPYLSCNNSYRQATEHAQHGYCVIKRLQLISWSFLLLPCTDALPFYNAYFGEHSSPGPNITYLRCYGNESQLLNCRYSTTTTCRISNVAGVRCQGEIVGGEWHNVTMLRSHNYYRVGIIEAVDSVCRDSTDKQYTIIQRNLSKSQKQPVYKLVSLYDNIPFIFECFMTYNTKKHCECTKPESHL